MTLVLAGTGLFVYLRVADELDRSVDRELGGRLAAVEAIVRDDGDDLGDPAQDPLRDVDPDAFVQVLDGDGALAGTNAPEVRRPVLEPERVRALRAGATVDARIHALGAELRLGAVSAPDDGVDYTVIAGASLEQRSETLADLRRVLLLGGPVALLLASIAGYGVASGALRPVEHMRRRAAEISAEGAPAQRLPVGPADDEISQLGRTLNEMLDRIAGALAHERAFMSDASHELRTPLAILKAELDLALAGGRSRAELEAALRSASEETDRLTRLAEDLLVLARADEGALPLRTEPLDLGALAGRVAARFSARATATGRAVAVTGEATVPADPLRIEQALSNLIDNALRYGDGDVAVEVRAVDGAVELHVRDGGNGFPAAVDGRVFERFARGDRGGSGLGLAIVAAIAEAHGGTAAAGRPAGGGTDVWLSLPA
ncbi:MAG TPA: ATP-binding protein [Solirubrobacteraceae bacterium]|nr:ATP-binding protein [Solirubrobacteraceae bacterium]